MLKQLQAERAKFYAKGYVQARQFVYDIDDEITKLSDRKKIYKEMEILAGSIGKGVSEIFVLLFLLVCKP